MEVRYTAPLKSAWDRTRTLLFQPMHLRTWLVVGFAAFLARLFSGDGGLQFAWNGRARHGNPAAESAAVLALLQERVLRTIENPAILLAIAVALVAFAIVLLVLSYASARAQFVFLDDVLAGRAAFVEPWNRSGRLGRSLFLWGAAFSFAWLLPLACVALPAMRAINFWRPSGEFWALALGMLPWIALAGVVSLVLCAVLTLMDHFVVPLMARHDEGAMAAWARFGALLSRQPGAFVAYLVYLFALRLLVLVGVLLVGVGTCCVGLLLLALPYVGSVLLLPIHATERALGPEFLRQFGPEWDVFPPRVDAPQATPPLVPPGAPLVG